MFFGSFKNIIHVKFMLIFCATHSTTAGWQIIFLKSYFFPFSVRKPYILISYFKKKTKYLLLISRKFKPAAGAPRVCPIAISAKTTP